MRASSPTKHRARHCRVLQDISAANRQCTPLSAPCGASTSPCRGGFIKRLPPGRLPCKGSCRCQATEGCGTRPCQYPPGLPQPCNAGLRGQNLPLVSGTMRASSPTQGRCGLYRLSVSAGRSQWFVGRAISPVAQPCDMTGPCGAALIQNRSIPLPQTSPAGVNARPAMQVRQAANRGRQAAGAAAVNPLPSPWPPPAR